MATLEQPQQPPPPPETAPGVVEQQQQQNGTTSTSNVVDEKPQTKRSNSGSFRTKPDNTNNKDLVYEITNYDVLFAPDDSSEDNTLSSNTGDLHDSIKTLPIQNKSTVRFASTASNHVGNNRFEVFLNMHRDSFQKAELAKNNKLQDEIIDKIINIITKQCDPQGRFLVQKGVDGRASWINIGEGYEAKEKIKGALRLSKIPVAPPPSAPQKETNDRRKSNDTEPASGSRNNSMHSVDISSMGGGPEATQGGNNNNNNTSLEVEEILVNDDSEDEQDEHTGKKQRRGTWRRRFSRGSLKIPTSIAFPTAAVGNMASSVRRGSSRLRQSFKDRMSITLTGDGGGMPGQQSTADAIAAAAGSFHDLDEEDDDDDSDVDSQKQERMKSKEELEKQAAQASKETSTTKGQQQQSGGGGLPSAAAVGASAAGNMMNNIRASGRNLRASFVSKMNKEAEPTTTGGGGGEQAPNPEEKKAMLTLRSSFKQMSSALSEKAANIPKAIRRGSVNPKMNIILTSTALLDPSPHYVGNNRFKISLEMYRDEFLRTSTSPERQEQIASSLVDTVYINWKGRFVKVFIVASVEEEDETEEQMEQHELSRDQAIEVTMKLLSINSTAVPPTVAAAVPPPSAAAVNITASNPEMTSKQQQPPQVVQPPTASTPAVATRPVIPPVINPASFQLQIPEDMQKMRNAAIRDLKEKKQKKDILSRIAQQNRRGGPAINSSNQQQQQQYQQQQFQQQQLQYQQQQQQQQQQNNNMMPAALRGFGGFNFSNFTGGGGGGGNG